MKLFGLGALWAMYALLVVAVSQIYMSQHPDRSFSISSAQFYDGTDTDRVRANYERLHQSQCAAWTKQLAILDHDRGATYQIQCTSWQRAIGLNLLVALAVFGPVAVVFLVSRKRAK